MQIKPCGFAAINVRVCLSVRLSSHAHTPRVLPMSMRTRVPVANAKNSDFQKEIANFQEQQSRHLECYDEPFAHAKHCAPPPGPQQPIEQMAAATAAFDSLTPVEQAAGSLGVDPNEWRPIQFMNNAHFDALMKSNVMDDTLVRRIEAFRRVATNSSSC